MRTKRKAGWFCLIIINIVGALINPVSAQSYDSRVNDAKIAGSLSRLEQNQRMERFHQGLEKSSKSTIDGPGLGIIFFPVIKAIDKAEMKKWEYIFPLIHDFDGPRLSYKEAMVLWKEEKKVRKAAKKKRVEWFY